MARICRPKAEPADGKKMAAAVPADECDDDDGDLQAGPAGSGVLTGGGETAQVFERLPRRRQRVPARR